jgi:multimeric flavodoxin WrbA
VAKRAATGRGRARKPARKPAAHRAARAPRVVRGMESVELSRAEFERRFRQRLYDPEYAAVGPHIDAVVDVAWKAYIDYHKSPRKKRAGAGFAEPGFELPVEWLAARAAVRAAERTHRSRHSPSRILLVNGSARTDQSCPGEMSKTYRLAKLAQRVLAAAPGFEVDYLDLSLQVSEYGRRIHPCKACVSTAPTLCHWPCSCYPNHALDQTQDWMNELYPRWVAAHGVMLVTPVNWYHVPSVLKLMIDRLVCADGGNPDPTTTHGKDPARAKAMELAGWDYPKHLAGRAFAVVVHGDAAGTDDVRRALCDWLVTLGLRQAGEQGVLDRYIGYYQPYATSHADLDRDRGVQEEVRNAARSLVQSVRQIRKGRCPPRDATLEPPRPK